VSRVGKNANVIYSEGYRKDGGAELAERAIAAAKSADVVIYIGGLNHDKGFDCEGVDRKDMKLPYGQDELIQKIVARIPKPSSSLKARWWKWTHGWTKCRRCCRHGIRNGRRQRASPRFVRRRESVRQAARDIPEKTFRLAGARAGKLSRHKWHGDLCGRLLVGYRWFDTKHIEPQFPFGFGLSFTTFKYSGLKLIPGAGTNEIVTAQFEIENTGKVAGAEVAQLYVHEKNPVCRVPKRS